MCQSISHLWLGGAGQLGVIIHTRPFKHRPIKIALPKVYTENTAKLAAYVGERDHKSTTQKGRQKYDDVAGRIHKAIGIAPA